MRDGTPNDDRLTYELGDLLFHWVSLCVELGQVPTAMLTRSRANIEARLAGRAVDAPARPHPEEDRSSR